MLTNIINYEQLDDLLKLYEAGAIDIDEIAKKIEENDRNKREEILKNHNYKIYQGTNGFWYTYLPDRSKKDKRVQIKRKNRNDLENEIVNRYSSNQGVQILSGLNTIRDLYPLWLNYVSLHSVKSTYVQEYKLSWQSWLDNDDIIDIPIGH